MNTVAKAEIVDQPVVRLTVELPPTHATELAGLLANHVSFFDFPWAESIYDAIVRAGIRGEYAFTDRERGPNIFLQRKQAERMADEEERQLDLFRKGGEVPNE